MMTRGEQAHQLVKSVLAWAQIQEWQRIEPIDPDHLYWLEERDLETIRDYLQARSCTYVLLRVNGEKEGQRTCADLLICSHPAEMIELPTKGYALMRCAGCQRMLFGHEKRYVSRSSLLVDLNAPPHYTRERFCTKACLHAYVTYLTEHADELFPHV